MYLSSTVFHHRDVFRRWRLIKRIRMHTRLTVWQWILLPGNILLYATVKHQNDGNASRMYLYGFHKPSTSRGQYFRNGSSGNSLCSTEKEGGGGVLKFTIIKTQNDESLWFLHKSLWAPLKTQRWNAFPYLESNSYRSHNLHHVALWFCLPRSSDGKIYSR